MSLPPKKLLAIFLVAFTIIIINIYTEGKYAPPVDDTALDTQTNNHQTIAKSQPQSKQNSLPPKQDTTIQKQTLPAGVNTLFYDKPETQVAWMARGKNIVIKNRPEAENAEFRNTFFHRGAKARPVTCGEVQFFSEDEPIDDFQRFIFTGLQSTYLEQDVVNFDIFWSIMCEQTLDEYFESQQP